MAISDISDELRKKVHALPNKPGVYQFFDKDHKIIYIGKAKNLKKRVSSYFTKNKYDSGKLIILVKRIVDVHHIIVDTESDALLLENNLVKKYQPKYNIRLKDDKTFPWICIKNEPFPRVFSIRKYIRDGSLYFGPYTAVNMVNTLLDLIREIYQLRTCSLNLHPEKIKQGNYKICLEHHIGNCKGACEGLETEEEYRETINSIKHILKGNISEVIQFLKDEMHDKAKDYHFEEAQVLKDKIELLEKYRSKSTVVSVTINNIDVCGFYENDAGLFVNYLHISNGAIIQAHTIEVKKMLDEPIDEILPGVMLEFREQFRSSSKEVVLGCELDTDLLDFSIVIPKIGDKKKLLDLSERNAKYYALEKLKSINLVKEKRKEGDKLIKLKNDLLLKEIPEHIECFDNSNLQGTNPVASCVVFKKGKPSKKDYRHFNIKTVEGPDDFASMEEVVYRRYSRLLNENQKLPQLVVIDGGKGQLGAAVKSLDKLNLLDKIAIIGIAKKLEEIFKPGDSVPLYLDKNSASLKLIQHLRNEAHRFGITFHRNKRSNEFVKSELEGISGIGEKTIMQLYTHFNSLNDIRNATEKNIADVIGASKAKMLTKYFNQRG